MTSKYINSFVAQFTVAMLGIVVCGLIGAYSGQLLRTGHWFCAFFSLIALFPALGLLQFIGRNVGAENIRQEGVL